MSDSLAVEVKEEISENANTEKYLIFSIMNKLYSFPSRHISEIAMYDTVYPLPLLPSYVLGVINRYSAPYALFDIGLLFFNSPSSRNKVLVIKEEIDRIAFLIDDVTGITDIQPEELISIERSINSNELTDAVSSSFNWNGNDVMVLDINRIIERVCGESE